MKSSASTREIRKAYRKRALRLHPDKNPGASRKEWARLQKGYTILSDPIKRAKYDLYLSQIHDDSALLVDSYGLTRSKGRSYQRWIQNSSADFDLLWNQENQKAEKRRENNRRCVRTDAG